LFENTTELIERKKTAACEKRAESKRDKKVKKKKKEQKIFTLLASLIDLITLFFLARV